MIRVRPAEPRDRGLLFDIWSSAVLATHDFLSPADRDEIARSVRDDYLPSADLLLAVDAADRPRAFMGMTGNGIDSLFVAAEARGQGFGSALLDWAGERHRIVMVDVNEQNRAALSFYERRGFTRVGRSPADGKGRPYPLLHLRRG